MAATNKHKARIKQSVEQMPAPSGEGRDYEAAVRNVVRLAKAGWGFTDLKYWLVGHKFQQASGRPFGPYQRQVKKILADNGVTAIYQGDGPPKPRGGGGGKRAPKGKAVSVDPMERPAPSEVAELTHDAIAKIPKGKLVDMLATLLSEARKGQRRVDRPRKAARKGKTGS